jgi:hypothetical protein
MRHGFAIPSFVIARFSQPIHLTEIPSQVLEIWFSVVNGFGEIPWGSHSSENESFQEEGRWRTEGVGTWEVSGQLVQMQLAQVKWLEEETVRYLVFELLVSELCENPKERTEVLVAAAAAMAALLVMKDNFLMQFHFDFVKNLIERMTQGKVKYFYSF